MIKVETPCELVVRTRSKMMLLRERLREEAIKAALLDAKFEHLAVSYALMIEELCSASIRERLALERFLRVEISFRKVIRLSREYLLSNLGMVEGLMKGLPSESLYFPLITRRQERLLLSPLRDQRRCI